MGGQGSGRWQRWSLKTTTESQLRIDIRWMKKNGYLKPGYGGSMSWECNGNDTGSVNYRIETDCMILNYRHRPRGGQWESVEQHISFDQTTCNYGGYRLWFKCPLCSRRVAILYGMGKYFYCRHCYGLTYTSQLESRADRHMRKARKIRKRLGASMNLMEPILFKPKNMHQRTSDRLRLEADIANTLSLNIMARRLGIRL